MTEWHHIELFADHLSRCAVRAGDTVVVLSETRSRPALVETARLAAQSLGAAVADVVLPTPGNGGPVPIRSTGASQAIQGHRAALAALRACDLAVDCTVEGLLHAPELGDILRAGTRILMIANEEPETFERFRQHPDLAGRVARGVELMKAATTMRVTSPAGTDLTVGLTGGFVAGSVGYTATPGDIAHWPGGLCLVFPAAGTVRGTLVLAPGDLNLTFKEYVRDEIRLTIEDDHVTAIDGDGVDAQLLRSYLAAWDERAAYAVSHAGFGMNPQGRWDALPLYDKQQTNAVEQRVFAGNFLYSTGANEVAGRFTRGHFDLPMRGCTISLDEAIVVRDGQLQGDLAPTIDELARS